MPSSGTSLDHQEMQDFLYRSLGRFFVAFARLELNLSLRVGALGTFQEKLERFIDAANLQLGGNDERYCELIAWYMAADSIRDVRNLFAHGRWGLLVHEQRVAHVSGYPPETQDERRYSLAQLKSILLDAEMLSAELCKFK